MSKVQSAHIAGRLEHLSRMEVIGRRRAVAKLPSDRQSLRLSWSDAVAGAELYVGKDVRTFASNWHFHEGWQLVAVTKGERHYELKSSTIIAKPGRLVLLPPRLVHRAHCLEGSHTSFRIATLPASSGDSMMPGTPMVSASCKHLDVFTSVFESLKAYRKGRLGGGGHLRAANNLS